MKINQYNRAQTKYKRVKPIFELLIETGITLCSKFPSFFQNFREGGGRCSGENINKTVCKRNTNESRNKT